MIVAILLLVLLLIFIFSIPAVQTETAHRLTDYLNAEFNTDINVKKLGLTYNAKVNLQDVYLGDHHGDTLIAAESIKTSLINIPGIVNGKEIDFGNLNADHLVFRLRRYKEDDKDNFGIFLDKLENKDKDEEEHTRVSFTHLYLSDSEFSFVDEHNEHPAIIGLAPLNVDASDFVINGGNISVDINKVRGMEQRGIPLENFSTEFSYGDDYMDFKDLNIETQQSNIQADTHFSFDSTMSDFENNVRITTNFKKASVSTTDIKKFYDELGYDQQLGFTGKMQGTLNDFQLQDFRLNGMDRTVMLGHLSFKNILGEGKFRFTGDFDTLETNYYDLTGLLPGMLKDKLPEDLQHLGNARLKGEVSVTSSEVKTDFKMDSQLGEAKLNATLSSLNSDGNETYKGNLQFEHFDLGRLLENPDLGEADFDLDLDGKGFETDSLNSDIRGSISALYFKGYTYRDIEVSGKLNHPIFNGEVISRDPNLQLEFKGITDVSGQLNNYDFKAEVDYANLHKLNFVNNDSIAEFKGDINMKMRGTNINDVVGSLIVRDASYKNRTGKFNFDQFIVNAIFEDSIRKITANSPDIIDGELKGHYKVDEIPELLRNAIGDLYTNYTPINVENDQYIDFDMKIRKKIIHALFPNFDLAANTSIKGTLKSKGAGFRLKFYSPEITVYNNKFKNVSLDLNTKNPVYTTLFKVDSVDSNIYDFSKIDIVSKRARDTSFVAAEFKGGERNSDKFNFNFYHTINANNKSVVGLERSSLRFKDNTWFLNKDRADKKIVFDRDFKNIRADTLKLGYDGQSILFNGLKKGDDFMDVGLDFSEVDLSKITPGIKDFNLSGILNGNLNLNQKKGVYYPGSDLKVQNFFVNDIDYGDLTLNLEGNESLTSYAINANLKSDTINYMEAEGQVNFGKENSYIDLNVDLNQFNLGILDAFGKDVIANIRGKATGFAHVGGDLDDTSIDGELELNNAGLKIPYLNVDLAFDEKSIVKLSKQQFYFDHVNFEDTKYHTTGKVDGNISHSNFSDWALDLDLEAPDRLLVLDTKETEDALYYGTAFITGNASIEGPFDELVIDASATSEKGTVFKIPLNDTETLAKKKYINFLTSKEKENQDRGPAIAIENLKGLEMNFDLNVTDDAEVEIVVDKKNGSTLSGTGSGTLLMEINTNGRFNMWGNYVVDEGKYNFKYAGLVEKNFEVVSGGTINWDGNPMNANLDVQALYKAEANPASILENSTVNRNIPIDVYVNLTGNLEDTDIDFELKYPNLSSMVKSELDYRINGRESTELQALSLITQNSFYNEFNSGQNAHPENLLFERASNVFNDLFSDEDDKFNVGVDYTQGNKTPQQDISDRVGVTLSTNINERVLINGKVGVPLGGLTRSVVVGNVEIEVLLNEKGSLRAKVFNRESDIQYIGEELGYTQGVGLSYSVDFDTFKELIHKVLDKKMQVKDLPKKIEGDTDQDDKGSFVPDYINFPGDG